MMVNTTGKRKNVTEIKYEPTKKALKKNEIMQEYDDLKTKYVVLEQKFKSLYEENKKNLEANKLLEETVQLLEARINQKSSSSVGVQTEDTERLWCIECEYPAEDLYDLGEHMYEVHAGDNIEYTQTCRYCESMFKTKSELMTHNKRAHAEKVKPCTNYLKGDCEYGDMECWFGHYVNSQIHSKDYKCNICKKVFQLRSDLMFHKKNEHIETVPPCKKGKNCHFTELKCWFRHSDNEKKKEKIDMITDKNENQEIIEKLFKKIEELTDRIDFLENKF